MPTATTRNRFRKPDSGSDNNVWGTNLNSGMFDLIDESLDGWTVISTATGTLTATQYVTNQARKRLLKYTSTGGTWVVPNLEKWYIVWNAGSGDLTLNAGGVSAIVKPNDVAIVICDGTDCKKAQFNDFNGQTLKNLGAPSANTDAATKLYVDSTAFAAGGLPGITGGTASLFVTNNGSTAFWGPDGIGTREYKTANYNINNTDRYKTIVMSSPATSIALPVGVARFTCRIYARTTLRLSSVNSETINGFTSIQLKPDDFVEVSCAPDSGGTLRYFVTWLTGTEGSAFTPGTTAPPFGPELIAKQQQASGVSPSPNTTTLGGYTVVGFNDVKGQQRCTSITSNIITISPGTYRFSISCPATSTGKTRLVLYNRSSSSIVFTGPTVQVGTSTQLVRAEGIYQLLGTNAASQDLEVRLYTESAGGNLGIPLSTGDPEVYSMMTIDRLTYGVQV